MYLQSPRACERVRENENCPFGIRIRQTDAAYGTGYVLSFAQVTLPRECTELITLRLAWAVDW